MSPPAPSAPPPPRVTLRALLLGLLGVCFICGLAPYNDFVAENTLLVGNFLPVGLLLLVLVLVLGVNVPVRRLLPRYALRQSELSVILAMTLASCAVPSSGLMRYLPSGIAGLYAAAADRPSDYGVAFDNAKLPAWLGPDLAGSTAAEKGAQPTITEFMARSPTATVPWRAWVRPILAWGVFVGLIWGLMIGLSLVVRMQWSENERLPFPLATVYESLIESPPPGRSFNALFSSRGFWIAAGAVFAVHGLNGLHANVPQFPEVPLYFDLQGMLTEPPWNAMQIGAKTAQVYFSMIGIAFFVQTRTAFSIWFTFLLWQIAEMVFGSAQVPFTDAMKQDQTFGGMLVYALVIVYVGRRHWWTILRHMVGRRRRGDTDGKYLPHAASGWLTAICFVGCVAWLRATGVTIAAGVAMVLVVALLFLTVARVLAETGLIFVQLNWLPLRGLQYPVLIPNTPRYTTATNFFMAGWLTSLFYDMRESLAAFFQLSVRVTDGAVPPRPPRRFGVGLIAAVALSLLVAYGVSWTAMLRAEYAYAVTTSASAQLPNSKGVDYCPRNYVLEPSVAYQNKSVPREGSDWLHAPLANIGAGGVAVGLCSVLRLWLPWWPLHPAALVVLYSYANLKSWFSIFLGWLAKVIVLRLGGAALLKKGRSVFIGLIVGEAFAAAVWLVINMVLNARGMEYKPLLFLPG